MVIEMSTIKANVSNGVPVTNGTEVPADITVVETISSVPGIISPSQLKDASRIHSDFEDALKIITKHSPVFTGIAPMLSGIAEAMDQHRAMILETRTKDKCIADLRSCHETMIEQTAMRHSKWDEEKRQHERRVTETKENVERTARNTLDKQDAAHTQEIAKLRKELALSRQAGSKLEQDLEQARSKMSKNNEQLNRYREQANEWKRYFSLLKDIDMKAFKAKIQQLFSHCHQIARNHFFRDLPKESFKNPQWENLARSLEVPLSFPPSNTPASKSIRMAACMHILARQLYTHFFNTCYIPGTPLPDEGIHQILARQLEDDPVQESLTRALILSTYKRVEVDFAIEEAVSTASNEVFKLLGPIGGDEAFLKAVRGLFCEAAAVWREAQHSKKKIVVSMAEDEKWMWSSLDDFTVPGIDVKPGATRFEMLHLFPCIQVPVDNYIVNNGYILRPDQNTVLAADQEAKDCKTVRRYNSGRNGTAPSELIHREVRPTNVLDGKNRILASSSAGARVDDKAYVLEPQGARAYASQTQNGNRGGG